MDEQFQSEHLMNHIPRKENGDYHHHEHHVGHSHDSLADPLAHHNHLLRHDMLTDAMLGHVVDTRDRDQVIIMGGGSVR